MGHFELQLGEKELVANAVLIREVNFLFVFMMSMYTNLFRNIYVLLAFVLVSGCTNSPKSRDYGPKKQKDTLPSFVYFTGNYVSPEYFKRNEGYDWVAVIVNQSSIDKLSVMVRSRADKKSQHVFLISKPFKPATVLIMQ